MNEGGEKGGYGKRRTSPVDEAMMPFPTPGGVLAMTVSNGGCTRQQNTRNDTTRNKNVMHRDRDLGGEDWLSALLMI